MLQTKRYISPGAWFAMDYPASWSEFEDQEGSFLFYNPDVWNGNFRISAYKGKSAVKGKTYAQQAIAQELKDCKQSRLIKLNQFDCVFSREDFQEEESRYTSYFWLTGLDDMVFECSFVVPEGGSPAEAEKIIASIAVRKEGQKYPAELIPVRLSEIYIINESYEYVSKLVKEQFKVDFHGDESDLENLQKIIDGQLIGRKKREEWLALGITLGVILTNEIEGMEWKTLIDGNREAPVLAYQDDIIDPMKLVWSKVKAGEPVNVAETLERLNN